MRGAVIKAFTRLIALFVVSLASALAPLAPAQASGSATLTIVPSANTYTVGSNFTISLRINSAEAVNAFQADLTYDQTKLQYISADVTGGAFPVGPSPTGGSGTIDVVGGSSTPRTGDQLAGTITFKGLAASLGTTVSFAGSSAVLRASDSTDIWNGSTTGAQWGLNSSVGAGQGGVGSAQYVGSNSLASGGVMQKNQYLMSSNGRYVLIFQPDGNLVLYGPGFQPMWQTATSGAGAKVVFQTDGNLVVYSAGGAPLWYSARGAALAPGGHLDVQNDGNVVLYKTVGGPAWWSGTGGAPVGPTPKGSFQLTSNQSLNNNTYLQSADGRYSLVMQTDGNLVLYAPGYHAIWLNGTRGTNCRLLLQTDGNLVLYNGSAPLWWTAGSGALAPGGHLDLQNDGNLVLYTSGGAPAWFSGTGNHF